MLRTLVLMRHAKSSWAEVGTRDFDRPLNDRGRKSVPRMARWLIDHHAWPDVILSSTSARTRETLHLLLETNPRAIEVQWLDSLYLADPPTLCNAIASTHHHVENALILAHNPGLEQLASSLASRSIVMPTAAVAVFQWNGPWDVLQAPTDKNPICLVHQAAPKELD